MDIKRLKTYIFVDFWNLQISLNENVTDSSGEFWIDWPKLPKVVNEKIAAMVPIPDVVGVDETRVYISFSDKEQDKRLVNWVNSWLKIQQGYKVTLKQRQKVEKPIHCNKCNRDITHCPHCSERIIQRKEKGIDTSIVTDMMKLAWENAFDIAVIFSADADYIPVAEYLGEKGKKIVMSAFMPKGKDLRQACWAHIDLWDIMFDIRDTNRGIQSAIQTD